MTNKSNVNAHIKVMVCLKGMYYLCHKWPRIWSTCRKHFLVLSSFTTYYRFCN